MSFLIERKKPKRSLERKFHPRPNDYIFPQPRYGGAFSNKTSKQKVSGDRRNSVDLKKLQVVLKRNLT